MTSLSYSNLPILEFLDKGNVAKAKMQITRQEPFILNLEIPKDVQAAWDDYGCHLDTDKNIRYDCHYDVLDRLAGQLNMDPLTELAGTCREHSTRVDIDLEGQRLIFHD